MNRQPRIRSRPRWIWLALFLALGFRALVPSGYMPMVEGGRLTMVLCVGDGPALPANPDASAHQHHAGMDMSGMAMSGDMAAMHHAGMGAEGAAGHDVANDAAHRHAPCLFAASALPSPVSGITLAMPVFTPASVPPVEILFAAPNAGILRAQSPRAPPALA